MIKLSDSINNLLKNPKINHQLLLGTIENQWENIVGKSLKKIIKPIKIKEQKLYIQCKNTTWKTEIQYQKKEIQMNINKKIKPNKIKEIILI